MSNRNLLILGLVAVTMVVWAVAMSKISSIPYAPPSAPGYLIQGLDPDQIASITIGKGDEQVRLVRKRQNFVVANKDNYPALTKEINKLITTCLDIRTAELYTDNPENFKDLGVTEEDARHLVKFFKADSNLMTGVVIGKQKERSEGIGYIRRVEDDKVYVTVSQIPWINKRATDYVEQELTSIKREDIESVTVSCPNETYMLRPGGDDKTVTLDSMPEGKSLKNDVAGSVLTALAEMRFDDVNAESSRKGLTFDKRYICRLKDSTAYTFWLAQDGDKWFAKCDAQFADQTPVTMTQGEVESEEELKKKEAKLLALAASEEFTKKHKGWIYQIPDYLAENLTKPLAELIEDSAKPEEQADVNALPGEVSKPAG